MKIIFLNIWNLTLNKLCTEFIKKHIETTDMFCFQEAYIQSQVTLDEILNNYTKIEDYKFVNDSDDFAQATYVNKKLNLNKSEIILKEVPEIGLGINVCIPFHGSDINVCNMHGISKPGNKLDNPQRLIQSQALVEYFKNNSSHTIIGGDFNLENTTKSIEMFELAGYKNLIKDHNIKSTRNHYVWDRYPESKQYYSDYIFVGNAIHVKEFYIPDEEISDHQAMILEID